MKQFAKLGRRLAWTGVLAALSACSVLESDKVDYKSAGTAPTLEVPPDLTKLSTESRYTVPGGPVTASGYAGAQAAAPTNAVAPAAVGDVRIERTGNQRWLVVDRPPEQAVGPGARFLAGKRLPADD